MLLQPFVNYNFGHGWAVTSSPIVTADWKASSANKWTVPISGGLSKLFNLGPLPINTSVQAYYNAEKPQFAADWQLRFQVQFLLPSFK